MGLHFIVKQTPTPSQPGGLKDSSNNDHAMTGHTESASLSFNENSKIGASTWKLMGNDEKITGAAGSDWDLGTTFTIDFWMRFDPFYTQFAYLPSEGGAKIISNFTDGGESSNSGYELGLTSGGELTATYYGDTGLGVNAYTITSSGEEDVITNGGWHHVCWQASDEGEGNVQRLFLDGVSIANGSISGTATTSTNPFTIGMRARSDVTIQYSFIGGTIDELEIIDGVAKFSTGGFTPPTTANTSTADHILLMHFDDDDTAATVWYDTAYYAPAQYWNVGGGQVWNGSAWTSFNSTWTAQYAWYETFRPTKMRITGTGANGSTVSLVTNEFHDPQYSVIGSISAANISTINTLTFDNQDGDDHSDMKYLQGMVAFATISKVEFDSQPITPVAA